MEREDIYFSLSKEDRKQLIELIKKYDEESESGEHRTCSGDGKNDQISYSN